MANNWLLCSRFISTIMDIPGNIIQSVAGIIVAVIFVAAFKNTPIGKRIITN